MFDMTQSEFLMSMYESLGKEGTITLLTKSIKKLSKDQPFRIDVTLLEPDSFIEIDFSNANVYLADINDERYATSIIENWVITNSSVI